MAVPNWIMENAIFSRFFQRSNSSRLLDAIDGLAQQVRSLKEAQLELKVDVEKLSFRIDGYQDIDHADRKELFSEMISGAAQFKSAPRQGGFFSHDNKNFLTQKIEPETPGDALLEIFPAVSEGRETNLEELLHSLRDERRFSEYFFLKYTTDSDSRADRLENIKLAVRCIIRWDDEFHKAAFRALFREIRDINAPAFSDFEQDFSKAALIVLHISCQKYIARAKASIDTFPEDEQTLNLLIVGDETASAYRFEPDLRMLVVPCSDSYESLPVKTGLALSFIGQSRIGAAVLKVDDDIHCAKPAILQDVVQATMLSSEYAGRVWDPTHCMGFDRTWHFDKVQCAERPYSRVPYSCYAEGPAYVLSASAVNAISKLFYYLPDEFYKEIYEDMTIGKVLSFAGVTPSSLDLRAAGVLKEVQQHAENGGPAETVRDQSSKIDALSG